MMQPDLRLTASPPDVRKVYDLPKSLRSSGGYAPKWGAAPQQLKSADRWGGATTAHQAAEPHSHNRNQRRLQIFVRVSNREIEFRCDVAVRSPEFLKVEQLVIQQV